ncbi:MAG: site-2 protease family protein [Gemmatirosa sp.]
MSDSPSIAAAPAPAPAPRAGRPAWLSLVLGAAVGGAIGYGAMRLAAPLLDADRPGRALLRARYGDAFPVIAATLVLLAAWVALAAHELGHVIGGRLARFRFQLFVVGPLRVERDEHTERLKVGLNREASLYGGVAASMPLDTARLRTRMALVVAGGPMASVLLAVAAWALARALTGAPLAQVVLVALSILSAGIACVTLIPLRSGGFSSDGARLLRLAQRGPEARREAATLPLIAMMGAGTPPREWPADMVRAAWEPADGSMEECFGQLLAYLHLLDLGRVEEAGAAIDRVMALRAAFPAPFAPSLDVEAAYFAGAHRDDAARARALLAQLPARSPAVQAWDRARAEAAALRAEGDAAGAARVAAAALDGAPASAAFTRARLAELAAAS